MILTTPSIRSRADTGDGSEGNLVYGEIVETKQEAVPAASGRGKESLTIEEHKDTTMSFSERSYFLNMFEPDKNLSEPERNKPYFNTETREYRQHKIPNESEIANINEKTQNLRDEGVFDAEYLNLIEDLQTKKKYNAIQNSEQAKVVYPYNFKGSLFKIIDSIAANVAMTFAYEMNLIKIEISRIGLDSLVNQDSIIANFIVRLQKLRDMRYLEKSLKGEAQAMIDALGRLNA